MSYTRHKYMGYDDLSCEELLVIGGYFLGLKMQPKSDFIMDDDSVIDDTNYYRLTKLEDIDRRIESPSDLDNLLQSDKLLSKDMRRFIADVVGGRVKPKGGRPPKKALGRAIHRRIESLLANKRHLRTTTNRDGTTKKLGAAGIIAEQVGLSEAAIISAYQSVQKQDWSKDKKDPFCFVQTAHYDDYGNVFFSEGYIV